MFMWQYWLIAAGVFLIIEIFTTSFLTFWFAIGALIAMIISLFIPGQLALQATVFVISSVILLFTTRKFVNKLLPKDKEVKTNANSIEGKKAIVISDIDPIKGIGQIKVDGETWSAKSSDNNPIKKDTEVTIEKIEGVKAVVKSL